jgi:RimJ/RimL family protein N-acetyltransferase
MDRVSPSEANMMLRAASTLDAQRLLSWRNDPATRNNSFTTEVVSLESHLCWLDQVLNDTRRELFIAEFGNETVGTVRLDYSDDRCELSWTVAPECRQRGLGRRMVALAINRASCTNLIAKIKSDNGASQQIVRALGFTEVAREDDQAVWAFTKTPSTDHC